MKPEQIKLTEAELADLVRLFPHRQDIPILVAEVRRWRAAEKEATRGLLDPACIWCRVLKHQRDEARRDLGTLLAGEEGALVRRLRATIRGQQAAAEHRNRQLDALSFVWCDGGCPTGAHRYGGKEYGPDDVTEAIVVEAERNTQRLRRWWVNYQAKKERGG